VQEGGAGKDRNETQVTENRTTGSVGGVQTEIKK